MSPTTETETETITVADVGEIPAEIIAPEPEPPTFAEWFGRVEKTAQFRKEPIPESGPEWETYFADGLSPVEAYDSRQF